MLRVSVLIPCRNGANTVAESIRSAFGQSEKPHEVIVIDDASNDDTAVVAERAGARVIRNETRRNAGGARNAGMGLASGDLFAFLDADAVANREWLARAKRVFESNSQIAGVGGRIFNGRDSIYGRLDLYMNHSEWTAAEAAGEKANIPTMGIVYRRSAVEGLRFPESNSGEDTAFAMAVTKRGGKLWFDPGIAITHKHERLDLRSYLKHQVVCGRTIYWTRKMFDRPGRFLVKFPILLFLFPHLWLMLLRMIRKGHLGDAVMLFPWFFAGELARVRGFFAAKREGVAPALYATEEPR
ncbi:MAG: glycosyltransferase family 2 protein [Thermoanaerobaculia bacterium]|nr:glycosyltransferase family 2 protein [Thermoanaerobaculia bacterium]